MNINRHNYEEFFLLYVDNELSATDRKTVDVFVQENPDLQIELVLLQQTIVQADDIVLDKKDWLYMEEKISALQENLLLYADEELLPADKESIEKLLATDKTAKEKWNILQQTKLQPDTTVVFEDKRSLYRKEGGRVVGFKWWRAAAAAVLLGFGLWSGFSVYKNFNSTATGSGELAGGNEIKQQQIITEPHENITTVSDPPENKSATGNMVSTNVQKKNVAPRSNISSNNLRSAVEKINTAKNIVPNENMVAQNNNNKKPDNNLPKSYLENINNKPGNESMVAAVLPENKNSNKVSGNKDIVVRTNPNEEINNTVVANLNKINTTEPVTIAAIQVVNNKSPDENNRYLDVDDDKEKRTALGGFLRKAKRMLERTTNVKAGDGIKIAGFEIAL